MDRNELKDALKDALEKATRKTFDSVQLADSANLREDLNLDSVDLLEMVWEIETRFDVSIDNELLGSVHTVGDVIEMVERRVGEGAPSQAQGA